MACGCGMLTLLCYDYLLNTMQGGHSETRHVLPSQISVGSSVERHSSEESETIVCSLLASPSREDVSSASPDRYLHLPANLIALYVQDRCLVQP